MSPQSNSSVTSSSIASGVSTVRPDPSMAVERPTVNLSKGPSGIYDPDEENKKLKKRILLSVCLALLLLIAFLVPVIIGLSRNSERDVETEKSPKNQSAPMDGSTVEPDDPNQDLFPEDDEDSSTSFTCVDAAEPDPSFDFILNTLPNCASPIRLKLPFGVEDVFTDTSTGIRGFGVHTLDFPEGAHFVTIRLKEGITVASWADGEIEEIDRNDDTFDVRVNYGRKLVGIHRGLTDLAVDEGDQVKTGEKIGEGIPAGGGAAESHFMLIDKGRDDGVAEDGGSYVSPFDYLEDRDKERLVQGYQDSVLKPFREGQKREVSMLFVPHDPYLTNALFVHNIHDEGTDGLVGEWYLRQTWGEGFPPDMITILKSDTPYFSGYYMIANDFEEELENARFEGEVHINATEKTFRVSTTAGTIYYGRYSVDDTRPRAILLLEYQTVNYPLAFTQGALEYIERDAVERMTDAESLGVIEE